MQPTKTITLRGMRVHNLKGVDVDIPLERLTVVTGVAGAGKSSLVFDTLYAEAQRRFLQNFSSYACQILDRLDQGNAATIGDLPCAVAIRRSPPPRATVGALTGIGAPLRNLFARTGTLVCPTCRQPVVAHHSVDVVAALQALPAGTRSSVAFPATSPAAADQSAWLKGLLEEGYFRIQIDGVVHRLGERTEPALPKNARVWVLLDRIEIGKTPMERLSESVDAAFRRGQGRLGILTDTSERLFDQGYVCAPCQRVLREPEPAWFQINGQCITDVEALPLSELLSFVNAVKAPDNPLRERLQALVALDLGYLTLQQPAATLSDGALRRIALATALASRLVHLLYLIDEPTVGLHPRDIGKLLDSLRHLRERGNTVVVVENDREIIAAADHVIHLGPGAGEEGGTLVYQGPPSAAMPALATPTKRRTPTGFLKLSNACVNNLQDLRVEFPLGVLCAVTGVTGAGKRSLVEQTLYPTLAAAKKKKAPAASTSASLDGTQLINDVVLLDQEPFTHGARSNPATYLKVFDEIRDLFAQTADARARFFGPGHFSLNHPGGRCETCEGHGRLPISVQMLDSLSATCPDCLGSRYRPEVLGIKVKSQSIAAVLDLTVREAFRFFHTQPAIEKKLKVLLDVGLAYLRLGQAVDTLAGGECQRLKLAGHLASSRKTGCLFLLIEPSAGLHPADVASLLQCFDRLLTAGHSLIVIEHDLDVIASADWVIDLGPEGGKGGGRIVAQGTPEEIARVEASHTGRMLG